MSTRHDPTHPGTPQKPGWKEVFLEQFALRANVLAACKAADVHRSTAYEARDTDEEFAAAWELARKDAVDRLAAVAWERSVDGWEQPVYQGGLYVGDIRKYDNGMLWKLMAAHDPDTYGQKSENRQTGPDGGPIRHHHTHALDPELVTTEELEVFRRVALRHEARQKGGE